MSNQLIICVYDEEYVKMLAEIIVFLNENDYNTEFFFINRIFSLNVISWH